ncbi:cysteine--tRNA ligase [Sulfitobacter aestuariivivens]|uniref:Cysteine--tRNA ligase n=1 Tax=Sulfitobacter aestuariivivens TaxID=2766981 RepID=A0A927D2Z8_9RHOB|nr:cysteine--tRNA ligase [Sulfitobacter aestuariivivens]MBD3663456.1 cysteine--tRNA ligase [Sulfitobacter aestuariivivens]
MTDIKLYNTATRSKEDFTPIDANDVRMYVCGPTVYDRAHLGNARPVLVFDVLYRLLRHVYGADHVTYVRNFTDVDDRINETAQKRKAAGADGTLEALIADRADETIQWYHDDMDALGALRPDHEPRATAYIAQMVALIEQLITDDFAYEKDGHVLFRVRKYDDYGKLSGRSVGDMIAGARVEVAPYKEDPMDFVLWKPSDADLPGWNSPWGRGRPGWHIECSAMAAELLGTSFDIHGGGNDLQFPHHENEIAQSRCAGHGFANVWMHNEMLQVEGKKMSKSLGNFFTVRDLLDQGVPGEVIRFVMLSTHYRKPMDWTEKKREEAEHKLRRYHEMVAKYRDRSKTSDGEPSAEIVSALANDLNSHGALSHLDHLANEAAEAQQSDPRAADQLYVDLGFLGILDEKEAAFDWSRWSDSTSEALAPYARRLQDERIAAKETKDFSKVDAIKAMLQKAGVEVRMQQETVDLVGTADFDFAKLEAIE